MEVLGASEVECLIFYLDWALSKIGSAITALYVDFIVVFEDTVGGNDAFHEEKISGVVFTGAEIHVLGVVDVLVAVSQSLIEVLLDAPSLPDLFEENEEFVRWFLLVRDVSVDGEIGAVHAHRAVGFGELDFVKEVEAGAEGEKGYEAEDR